VDRTELGVLVTACIRRTALCALLALLPIIVVSIDYPKVARAGTVGNPSNYDVFEAGSTVQSAWWGSASKQVGQRFGCTDVSQEPSAPPGLCPTSPSLFTHWHQGIDISLDSGTAVQSQFDGTVIDVEYAILGILTSGGKHRVPVARHARVWLRNARRFRAHR
jgi:hypothetical protein